MEIDKRATRKIIAHKIDQLNDIIADMDILLTSMQDEFYRVCIFGSARIEEDHKHYRLVKDLAVELAKQGVDIVTGGGPGLMEAANKGAQEGSNQSRTFGLPIELPFEADTNQHLDVKHEHRRFSTRLDEFMRLSHAVIVTPGGIGTLLELLYTWQLIQVEHIEKRPLILVGDRAMWESFIKWIEDWPLKAKLISPKDLEVPYITDSVKDVMDHLLPDIEEFRKRSSREKTRAQSAGKNK